MDIQRIVLFAGLAIVSYLMVLAWNEDYHQQPQPTETAQVASTTNGNGSNGDDGMVLPEQGTTSPDGSEEFSTPESGQATVSTSAEGTSVDNQFITIRTDVYDLTIDRVSGNLVHSSLINYDKSLNSEEPLQLLTNTETRTYLLESGLIGRDGPERDRKIVEIRDVDDGAQCALEDLVELRGLR